MNSCGSNLDEMNTDEVAGQEDIRDDDIPEEIYPPNMRDSDIGQNIQGLQWNCHRADRSLHILLGWSDLFTFCLDGATMELWSQPWCRNCTGDRSQKKEKSVIIVFK